MLDINPLKQRKKIAFKLTLRISLVLLAVFTVMILNITGNVKRDLTTRELEKLQLLASQNAQIASKFMETMLSKQEVLVSSIGIIDSVAQMERESYLKNLLTTVKKEQPDILSLFYVAEPNTLMPNTPNGFSIFATAQGTTTQSERFTDVKEDVYRSAIESKQMVLVDPFYKTIDGKEYMVLTIFLPVMNNAGSVIGMVGSNLDVQMLANAPYSNGGFKSFINQIICSHQTVIVNSAHPDSCGKNFIAVSDSTKPQNILDSANDSNPYSFLDVSTTGEKSYSAFIPFQVGDSTASWLSGTSISKKEFDAQMTAQTLLMVAIAAFGLVLLMAFCYYSVHITLKPIAALDNAAHQMADGNLDVAVAFQSNDELGGLAESFNESASSLSFYIGDIGRAMEQMSNGDFNLRPSKPFIGDFAGIERSIGHFILRMSQTLYKINDASNQVSMSAELVSSGSMSLSQGASEQASSVEELSATMEEISNQVKKNAVHARATSLDVDKAGAQILHSNARMQEMITAMEQIRASSDEIGKIIKSIHDIAFQTNILALNAAVEAARAGASGKGFAVVASEVRSLASKSAEAAQSSTQLIENSIQAVRRGVEIASNAAESMEMVTGMTQSVVHNMDEISNACMEQAEAIAQVTLGTEQISVVIQSNSATAQESAAASEELSAQAQMLKKLVSNFRLYEDAETAHSK